MAKPILGIMVLFLLVSLYACNVVSEHGDAQDVAEAFLKERISAGGFEGPSEYYSDLFWQNTDDEKWNTIKTLTRRALGDLQNYSLSTWNIKKQVHSNQLSGTFVVFVFETEYEKGRGNEKLTMFKALNGEEFKILGHHIDSPEIQKLVQEGIENVVNQ